ncbi:MAG: HAMP domain-containing histidine kinase, partial [Nitrospirales bacterium]|nr:HAMP domain-containing histidine kinase [Nitrospirales bacterium]
PVSVIKGTCDVFLQQERSKEEYQEALQSISSVTVTMSRLIGEMLSIARLDSGALTPEDFRKIGVSACIEDALRMIRPLSEKRHITITTSLPEEIRIMGDRSLMTEAFLNILTNAVKYNREQGSVEIASWEKEGKVFISIKDTGIGISAEEQDKIFERFYRSDEVMQEEGTGLGLSITKEIVKAHHGDIAVESSPGEGSRFIVTFVAASHAQEGV